MDIDEKMFLVLLEGKVTWADVPKYIDYAIYHKFNCKLLAPGLQSEKKQAIEILTRIFAENGCSEVSEELVQMMIRQVDGANSIRGRDALIKIGEGAFDLMKDCLIHPNWKIRQYAVQFMAISGKPEIVDTVAKIALSDKSKKVRETALQAIEYWQGDVPPEELDLIPSGSCELSEPHEG